MEICDLNILARGFVTSIWFFVWAFKYRGTQSQVFNAGGCSGLLGLAAQQIGFAVWQYLACRYVSSGRVESGPAFVFEADWVLTGALNAPFFTAGRYLNRSPEWRSMIAY